MLPAFKKLETWSGVAHFSRGDNGPVHVRRFNETEAACEATMQAFINAGVPYVEDYSIGITHGTGRTQATQRRGWRHSAASAYLRPARRRKNLRVATNTRVDRVLLSGTRCTGVEALRRGVKLMLRASREVIVAAGAIGTPKLLLLSGIGAPDALAAHGILPRHELPGVGRGMNDHVNIKISAFVDTPTYNTARSGLKGLRHGVDLIARGRGPASSPANHCQAFVKTDAAQPSADVHVQLMAFGFGTQAQMRCDGITAVVSPCQPRARGAVSLRSANPAAPPRINMPMLSSPDDVDVLHRGCALTLEMLHAGPSKKFNTRIYAPAAGRMDKAALLKFFRETAALNWHPTSTCRMGPNPADGAVVDSTLAVHGLSGLSIADASVMPAVTSGNTNVPVIAIAERAAGFVAARNN
jgi:choline dehydrogenase-like flavoprotein